MEVKYICHSGFMVELEKNVLIFDYYTGAIPAFDKTKKLYVFVSHKHFDHFNKVIFNLFEDCNVKYILSKDCAMNEKYLARLGLPVNLNDKITYVRKSDKVQVDDLHIETIPSSDAGVAYMVNVEGKSIYHAGDNGMWLWPDNEVEANKKMEVLYKTIIDKIEGREFDVAFVPADPKLLENSHKGLLYFLEKVNVDKVYPIHLWEKSDAIKELLQVNDMKKYEGKIVNYFL